MECMKFVTLQFLMKNLQNKHFEFFSVSNILYQKLNSRLPEVQDLFFPFLFAPRNLKREKKRGKKGERGGERGGGGRKRGGRRRGEERGGGKKEGGKKGGRKRGEEGGKIPSHNKPNHPLSCPVLGHYSVRGILTQIRAIPSQEPAGPCFEVHSGRPRKHPRDDFWEVNFRKSDMRPTGFIMTGIRCPGLSTRHHMHCQPLITDRARKHRSGGAPIDLGSSLKREIVSTKQRGVARRRCASKRHTFVNL